MIRFLSSHHIPDLQAILRGSLIVNMKYSVANIPSTINGLALANVGIAVLWLNLGMSMNFLNNHLLAFVYSMTIYAVILVIAFFMKIIFFPAIWFRDDFSSPSRIFRMGVLANAVCLIALTSSTQNLHFPETIPLTITFFGMAIQFPSMLWFLYQCARQMCPPEPYYNAAIQSCLFPVISLPGNSLSISMLRKALLYGGLLTLIPSSSIQLFRVLIPRKDEQEIVANNPSVGIMQSGWSICLLAWLIHPITSSATDGFGLIVSNIFFALSIVVDVLTWIAIYQRRKSLWALGADPFWSAIAFPFASSALAASLYHMTMTPYLSFFGEWILFMWIWFLAIIATILVTFVNIIFIMNKFGLVEREERHIAIPANEFENEVNGGFPSVIEMRSSDTTRDCSV